MITETYPVMYMWKDDYVNLQSIDFKSGLFV